MTTGSISFTGQATLPVSIMDEDSGLFVDFNLVIDTGFNEDLQLPIGNIVRLNLPFIDRGDSQLADGRVASSDVYEATVLWFGNPVTVNVIATEVPIPLIGVNLLWDNAMAIEWELGGRVSVEPLSETE